MDYLIFLNIVATLFTAYWLTKKVTHQEGIIKDQTQKLADLEKYTNLMSKLTDNLDPSKVLKLLDNERYLMSQDTEILRRQTIKEVNNQLTKEWSKVVQNRVIPIYEGTMTEFSNFIFFYFSNHHYPNKEVRNGDIRLYFPNNAEMIIKYLDEVREPPENQ